MFHFYFNFLQKKQNNQIEYAKKNSHKISIFQKNNNYIIIKNNNNKKLYKKS